MSINSSTNNNFFNVRFSYDAQIFYSWNREEQGKENVTTIRISKLLRFLEAERSPFSANLEDGRKVAVWFKIDGQVVKDPHEPVFYEEKSVPFTKGDKVDIWLEDNTTEKVTLLAFKINLPSLDITVQRKDGEIGVVPLGSINSKVEE